MRTRSLLTAALILPIGIGAASARSKAVDQLDDEAKMRLDPRIKIVTRQLK